MSLDHISFSPSLPKILSLIQPREIINCQLVSGRFHEVIRSNSLAMSRIRARMHTLYMETLNSFEDGLCVKVKAEDEDNVDRVDVSEGETCIMKCEHKLCVRRQYRDNGYRPVGLGTPVIPSPGMKESLRLLFSHYFKQYHYHWIEFEDFDRAHPVEIIEWCEIIGDELRKCRTKCRILYLELNQGNSSRLSGDPIITHARDNLQKIIQEILRWDMPLSIRLFCETFENFMSIMDILKNWSRGIVDRVPGMIVNQKEKSVVRWNLKEVVEMLNTGGVECRRSISTNGKKMLNGNLVNNVSECDTFYITREEVDSRIMEVRYSQVKSSLTINETKLISSSCD